ncbi:ryanodine-sensitive calcium-release channel [Aureococcus anophagefferens]|nr:ryanodine-sensitive calcium-release channel [Aureococcus anophagefferens]
MVLFALVARATVDAAFEVYENADVGHGRLGALALLGSNVTSPRACQALCVGACRSFVFYHSDYRDASLAAACHGGERRLAAPGTSPSASGATSPRSRDPSTGEFVLFWTASFGAVPCSGAECGDCDDGDSVGAANASRADCLPDASCTWPGGEFPLATYMSFAADPSGPWSDPVEVPAPGAWDTNLAPIIRDDGSLVGLGRPPYVWRAADWRNASTYAVSAADATIAGEDPYLYVDARDPDVLHALSHAGGWDSSGGHAWSVDGGDTWRRHDDVAAYGASTRAPRRAARVPGPRRRSQAASSSTTTARPRRSRAASGPTSSSTPRRAVALANGARAWPCTHPLHCPRDACFTALQRLSYE